MTAGVAVVAALVVVVAATSAGAASPQEVASNVSEQVMSPFCPGVTLHDCASRPALELRDRIEQWAASGLDEAAILVRLEDEFGPAILAVPRRGPPLWLVPLGGVLAAALVAAVLGRRWTRPRAEAQLVTDATAEERARLDALVAAARGER